MKFDFVRCQSVKVLVIVGNRSVFNSYMIYTCNVFVCLIKYPTVVSLVLSLLSQIALTCP